MVYTATWVSYNGFSLRVFIFGWICYGTMIIGHAVIRRFQSNKLHINTVLDNIKALQAVNSVEMTATPDGKSGTAGQTDQSSRDGGPQIQDDKVNGDPKAQKESEGKWLTQKRLKTIHGVMMFISLFFMTGAGIGFTRRFAQYEGCTNVYCSRDVLEMEDGSHGLPLCWLDSTS